MLASPAIYAIGTAVPANKISQAEHFSILESANGLSREEKIRIRKVYSHSGIDYRYSVLPEFGQEDHADNIIFNPANHRPSAGVSVRMSLYEKHAAELCEQAVRSCVAQLDDDLLSQVTHLVTFSCTGMYAPGLDIQLVQRLGLAYSVERTCINFMGCYAGINALKTAHHIAVAIPNAVILVTGVEICTIHYRKSEEQDQVVANALFADGAAACVVSRKKLKRDCENEINPGRSELPTVRPNNVILAMTNFYSEFDPAGNDEMVWRIGDLGFELRLSSYVPMLIRKSIFGLVEKLFAKAGIAQADIAFYALHPGGRKILEVCEEALHISKEANKYSYEVLQNYGNMSSVTIFFVLQKMLQSFSNDDEGKRMLACAFGPGLTMESMIMEIAHA